MVDKHLEHAVDYFSKAQIKVVAHIYIYWMLLGTSASLLVTSALLVVTRTLLVYKIYRCCSYQLLVTSSWSNPTLPLDSAPLAASKTAPHDPEALPRAVPPSWRGQSPPINAE